MKAILGARWFWLLLALILLSVVIWFIGPYISIADFKPLESVVARVIAIALLVVLWGLKAFLRELRALRATQRLTSQLASQQEPAQSRGSPESRVLQQRFEEAVALLRKSKSRKGRVNLYELPWYIIIGPPGSGKTTAIVNSGLNFPLEQKFGKGALRGVGGTRNCDWWFTDEAVLIDTAGRYTTQDSDATSDAAGWVEFLTLLRKYRKRQPINGVMLAISLADLAMQSEAERARHVAAIRERLEELRRHLDIQLPVYLLLTKCDLLAGFSEFFDDLPQEGRAQVWGVTFPIEDSRSGEAARQFDREFDLLLVELNSRVFARMEAERDVQRRGLIFGFPRQLAGVQKALSGFITEIFGSSSANERVTLRGVYLTSGTQEGTPIDRMLGALARTFGFGVRALNPQSSQGKAYFIRRLLSEVLFRESGLAGVSRRTEVRAALLQAAVYIGIAAITVVALVAFTVSYGRNRAYVQNVAAAVEPLRDATAAPTPGLVENLPRLDAFERALAAADEHAGNVPVSMRAGLYQGSSLGNAARDAYLRELNTTLAPALAELLRMRLGQLASQPDKLYEYLKVYLMLGQPRRLEPAQVSFVTDIEWRRLFPGDDVSVTRLHDHVSALISDKSRMQPAAQDDAVVEQARTSLRQASLPVLMYSRLKLGYAGDEASALNLKNNIGLGADSVFVRREGALDQPISALYTRKAFDEVATTGKLEVVQEFVSDSWVLGEGVASIADAPRLSAELMRLYEDDYIRTWDAVLAGLQPKPTSDAKQLADVMALLGSASSPLKRLLVLVEANTNLLKPLKDQPKSAEVKAAIAKKLGALEKMFGSAPATERPGTRVTRHFAPLHKLVEGPPGAAPIDQTLRAIAAIQQRLAAMSGGLGNSDALAGVSAQGQADALGALRVEAAQLPPPISGFVSQIGSKGEALAKGAAGRELASRYQTEVAAECRQLINGRYPFVPNSATDVALADFGRLFGFGGVFETFFRDRLAPLVDTSRQPWRWREGAGSIGGSNELLAQFQAVERIRQVYFRPGGQMPEMRFNLTPDALDATVRRLAVEIDGQTLEYRHGPPRTQSFTWPGPASGQASVLFEEAGGSGPNRAYQGPWALFRLLGEANVQPQSDVRYVLTLNIGGRTARVVLEATSVRNPFGRVELRNFRCGS